MKIEEIVARIRDIPTADVARATGLTYNTIKNIKAGGGTYSKTLTALASYVEKLDNPSDNSSSTYSDTPATE